MSRQTVRDVRVLVSFYTPREDGSICIEALNKKTFCVPVGEARHKDLLPFKTHGISFTDLKTAAVQNKGIEQSLEINSARVMKNSKGGENVFSIRTQDSQSHAVLR